MKLFVVCSKKFYGRIPEVEGALKKQGHVLTMPNCYDAPGTEDRIRALGPEEHGRWKGSMIAHSERVIEENDGVLVLNFDKGAMRNYIGGATFLEMYDAFRLGKKIFLYNDPPDGILHDEVIGFSPIVLKGDLSKVA
jgi:hypothetical protein